MRPGSAGPWTGSSRSSRSSPRAPPSGRRPDDEGRHGEPQGSAGGEGGSAVRGASRASLAEAKGQLAAVISGGADPGQLGDELFAVAGLLDAQAGLRRTLSDPTRDARAKTALVTDLLGSRIAPATLDLVRGLVGLRWSEPADLADAAEQLGAPAIIEIAPGVIGGMTVEISGELIEGSMASRLAGLRRRLAS